MTAPAQDAPALLRISAGGSVVCEIADHEGEVLDYHLEAHPGGGVAFRRLDGRAGPYRVGKPPGRLWACTCDDSKHRARRECRYCKHRVFCLRLLSLAPIIHALEEDVMAKAKPDEKPAPQAAPRSEREESAERVAAALAAPFDSNEIKFKPQTISGNRALAVPFVDARVIQDRLDDVLGVMSWQDSYEPLPSGSVVCRLKLCIAGEWITKEDVGSQSEQTDEGDRTKAAFSDALKRAAVKFGVGRYLYRQKPQWLDYDVKKRQFVGTPSLPTAAPKTQPTHRTQQKQAAAPVPVGRDFLGRLHEYDAMLAGQGLCKAGDLVKYVAAAGEQRGFPADMTAWDDEQIALARAATRAFEAQRREKQLQKTA